MFCMRVRPYRHLFHNERWYLRSDSSNSYRSFAAVGFFFLLFLSCRYRTDRSNGRQDMLLTTRLHNIIRIRANTASFYVFTSFFFFSIYFIIIRCLFFLSASIERSIYIRDHDRTPATATAVNSIILKRNETISAVPFFRRSVGHDTTPECVPRPRPRRHVVIIRATLPVNNRHLFNYIDKIIDEWILI